LAVLNPNDGELAFWMEVWATWNKLNGRKPKTEAQVRKWLANPHSDSAEYKLWGNGISLPIVYFVLSGIKWVASRVD
jgi:DNA (cytosine-5)-methyltransferase 1